MKLRSPISLFLINLAYAAAAFAQLVRVAETDQLTNRMPVSSRIDQKLMPRITVRIQDFDHVPPGVLASAREVTSEILQKAGLATTWVDCFSQERCTGDSGGPEFRIRLVPQALGNAMVADDSMGFAVPCAGKDEACICYVFYWRIKAVAEDYGVAVDRLLGHVVAHEIGHVLLGPNAHNPYGIMQHNLPLRETGRILYFTSGQAKRLRADLLSRMQCLAGRD